MLDLHEKGLELALIGVKIVENPEASASTLRFIISRIAFILEGMKTLRLLYNIILQAFTFFYLYIRISFEKHFLHHQLISTAVYNS